MSKFRIVALKVLDDSPKCQSKVQPGRGLVRDIKGTWHQIIQVYSPMVAETLV